MMTMTSTYDHRVIQGAESGEFLKTIDGLLQGEDDFYEEIFGALGVDSRRAAALPLGRQRRAPPRSATCASRRPTATRRRQPPPTRSRRRSSRRSPARPTRALLQAVQAATSVVKAFRMHGHLAANLDPLGSEPPGDPALDPETVNLTPELMEQIPARVLRIAVEGETFADALPHLQETYCGTIAYEIEHISDHEQRVWLRQAIESNLFRQPLDARGEEGAAGAAVAGRGARELPAQGVPRQEAVLDRGPRRDGADAGRGARHRRPPRRARGRDRHGPPRPAERAGAHRRPPLRGDPRRVRGRAAGGQVFERSRCPRAAPAT